MSFNKLYIVVGAGSGLGHEFVKNVSKKNKTIGTYNKTKREGNKNTIYFTNVILKENFAVVIRFSNKYSHCSIN